MLPFWRNTFEGFGEMIQLSHISKKYGKRPILHDVSFQVKCGECVAIVGRNGSGKSTLLQIMAGVLKADAGSIRYFGQEAGKNRKIFRKYCGYVPQDNPLIEELSVKDNLKLWGISPDSLSEELLARFQLKEIMNVTVSKLSGGMKRRLGIVCALADNPPIMLLDEPTTALDICYQEGVSNWIKDYRSMNGIVVMTTHNENEILAADRCLVMNEGKLIELTGDDINMQKIRAYIITE